MITDEIRTFIVGLAFGIVGFSVGLIFLLGVVALFLGAAWSILIAMYYLTMP